MNQAQQRAIELLRLPDEQYDVISQGALDVLGDRIAPADDETENGTVQPIVAINGPRTVDFNKTERVPVLVAKRWTGQRSWEVDLDQNLTWIITDLQTGAVKAICPLPLDKRRMQTPKPSGTPPAPSPLNSASVMHGVERMNLPSVFGPNWPSSSYAATLVLYNWPSNTVVFQREPRPAPPEETAHAPSKSVESSPSITPGLQGIELSFPSGKGPSPIVLRGNASLPRDQVVLLKSSEETGGLIMPVTLVLLKLDSSFPAQFDLAISVTESDGMVGTRFSMDLHNFAQSQGLSGVYQMYVVAGQIVSGPETIQF